MEIVWQLPAGITFIFIYKTHISIKNVSYGSTPTSLLKWCFPVKSEFPFTKAKFDNTIGIRLRLKYKKKSEGLI